MSTVVCKVCGKEFESPSGKAIYCSQACRGTAFLKQHNCSMSEYRRGLYKKNKKKPEPRKCSVCGKEFVPDREGVEYCSRQCRYKRQNILARVKKNNELAKHMNSYGRLQIQCDVCRKWFTPETKGQVRCRSCQIFVRYMQQQPPQS